MSGEPELAKDAVLQESEPMPKNTPEVKGYDFNQGVNYEKLLASYKYSGFQATNFGKAVDEINKMIESRSIPLADEHQDSYEDDEFIKRTNNCTIFFGYTSNMVSSGLRDTIRFLAQHKMIDCIVTTAGIIQISDFMLTQDSRSILFQVESKRISSSASLPHSSVRLNSKARSCEKKESIESEISLCQTTIIACLRIG